ncbi:DUF983 domain-containing protein [Flavobacterium pallidum]|uniref:DUF983 domain-containing protein n=1 Tax=Flavobacterium pallidum TaxID=2172098 RepID=A0A2S1SI46_9FLAO|nr:DUF983 domain-containing protein [Flavobacterium pallidum]AWI26083.1 DUF983 domain-containing protein [Flavobacterium pallidum]
MCTKGTKLYSIATGTCPKCQAGKMYTHKNPYNLTKMLTMHEHCSHCGFQFMIEPNFFFGAMYVSYGLAVMAGLFTFLITHYGFHAGVDVSFISILTALLVLLPLITRLSRSIYINIFVNYEKALSA